MTEVTIRGEEDDSMLDVAGYAVEPLLPVAAQATEAAKVLVVDDDSEMRALVEETLREEGYRTVTAPDTLSALILLLGEGADVLITDWKMPAPDGLDLLDSVARCLPGMPVIFVTAYADADLRKQALERGAFSFLAKPFRRAELREHLEAALAFGGGRGERRSGR